MSLRDEAHNDLIEIIHSDGDLCTITNPALNSASFHCLSNDIHLSIDPGTGTIVTGRQASITVLIADLLAVERPIIGFEKICGVADSNSRPWVVEMEDVNGRTGRFKVIESHPDRGAGLMTLCLEIYQ
jgi:hypothetical protein